jgi:hypothetical protein
VRRSEGETAPPGRRRSAPLLIDAAVVCCVVGVTGNEYTSKMNVLPAIATILLVKFLVKMENYWFQ